MTIKLSANLKKLLNENDLTVAQLSRASKIPPQTLHNWLHGQEPKNFLQIKKLANHFEMSVDELVYGERITSRTHQVLKQNIIQEFENEINAGTFEVVLRRVKK
jgi:predicted transcriptional regulator